MPVRHEDNNKIKSQKPYLIPFIIQNLYDRVLEKAYALRSVQCISLNIARSQPVFSYHKTIINTKNAFTSVTDFITSVTLF
jgi:hypothetical protein